MNQHNVCKGIALGIIFSLFIPGIISSEGQYYENESLQSSSQQGILYVGGDGPGNYSKIQDAINDSNPGGTVYVYNESSPYFEHLVIQKSISLIGEDKQSTEINGSFLDNSLDTVQVMADSVILRNFRLSSNNGYYYQAAVKITGDALTLSNCVIQGNEWVGIYLFSASFCTVIDCEFSDNLIALNLVGSDDNIILNCSFYQNEDGVVLSQSSDRNHIIHCLCNGNSFSGIHIQQSTENQITDCLCRDGYGITLSYAPQTRMRNNTLLNNIVNFGIGSPFISDFYCDIDTSNTINGKPIYYLIDTSDMTFNDSVELGFLGLVNCRNISVKNLHFEYNFEGLLLAGTVRSSVENCSFTNNEGHGMYIISSHENSVKNCTFRNGYFDGILLFDSSYNTIENCSSENSYAGVKLEGSTHNIIRRQTIDKCSIGILFDSAGNNTVTESQMFHCGLHVIGDTPSDHINYVDISNVVNGRPLYYFIDKHNMTVPSGAGQVILVSCENCIISSQNLSNTSIGIELAYSSSNTIDSNILNMNTVAGIDFDGVNNNMNIIENNIIQGNNYGMDIDASVGNNIQDNIFLENGLALSLDSSEASLIERNTIQDGSAGISFDHSINNNLMANSIRNMSSFGLYFLSSNGNDLQTTTFENCGLLVYGDTPIEYFNDVDTSNTVNGKPLYYLLNKIDYIIPSDAGEVILVNSSDCTMKNLDLRSGTVGITFAYSSHNLVRNNRIENQSWTGIDLSSSSNNNNTIQNNKIQYNSYGIDIEYCTGNTLKNNIITSNSYGILLYNTVDTIIRRNTIVLNSIGIDAIQTKGGDTIHFNNIFLNSIYGLSAKDCLVSALRNWWGSSKGPTVDRTGNGDRLNTIGEGQILYIPWHHLPILFSGILRFVLTIIQEKNPLNQSLAQPTASSLKHCPISSIDFDFHGLKTGNNHQEQTAQPFRYREQDFDSYEYLDFFFNK